MTMPSVKTLLIGMAAVLATVGTMAAAPPEAREVVFEKTVIDKAFRSEGVAVADVNRDGRKDILVGDLWYEAPDWKIHEIRKPGKFVAGKGYSNCFNVWTADINGDGWEDQMVVIWPGKPGYWYENPRNKPGHWKERVFAPDVSNETPVFADLLGNGKPVGVFGCKGAMVWASPGKDPNRPFDIHRIDRGPKAPGTKRYSHGLGVGDVNGDGRNDVLTTAGWWQAPEDRTTEGWKFHKADLGPDCADMLVYDVDGDGDNDIITSSAHKHGIWWHEQKPTDKGSIFVRHEIAKDWSQVHAMILVDVNGDGVKDFVTGKRWLAHNGGDPGSKDPAVMYWYEIRRGPKGKAEFIPHKFDDSSGVGTQFTVCDLNDDGLPDVVTSNKGGVRLFIQRGGKAGAAKAARLFDAKTLRGWEGDEKFFRVDSGAIVGGSLEARVAHNAFLCTTKEYGDFELRLKVRLLGKNANAGIQFRSKRIENHHEVIGYQADMGQRYWGCLYDESRRRKVLAGPDKAALAQAKVKPEQWNDYVIRAEGPRVRLWLNGVKTADYTEPDAKIARTGVIGLQIHGGPPSEAWYKDITLTELK